MNKKWGFYLLMAILVAGLFFDVILRKENRGVGRHHH